MDEALESSESLKELLSALQEPSNIYPLAFSMDGVKAALKAYRDIGSIEHFRELAEAEKEGRLLVRPCKKGDLLWSFYNWPRKAVYSFRIVAISTIDDVTMLNTDKLGVIPASDVGKTVFLSREEAEVALDAGA